jgi:Lon-like protease
MRRILLTLAPAVVLALCLYAVDLPYFVEGPGSAKAVLPLIDIDGTETYSSKGDYLLTTVNVGRVNVFDALAAWVDPTEHLVPEEAILAPGLSDREYERVVQSQMDQSKIAAVAVALERLTEYPRDHGPGAIVQDAIPGSPSEGKLFAGDLITTVDGDPLAGLAELRERVEEAGPSALLRLTVEPVEGGEARRVEIRPRLLPDAERPVIGVYTVANFPFQVRIESGTIGGPSAGLMWALGVIDLLTPGDLTGGRTLAGTGSVDLNGNVGPIGGVTLKLATAAKAGAESFLVPQGNLAEAREAGTDIELVPVSTVGQAVRALEAMT